MWKAVVSQLAQYCSLLVAKAGRTATFFHPTTPWPDPYLTLVRSLRSMHLLDVSVQVIRPEKEINRL